MSQALPREPEPSDGMTLGLRLLIARKRAGLKLVQIERTTGIPNYQAKRDDDDAWPPVSDATLKARGYRLDLPPASPAP